MTQTNDAALLAFARAHDREEAAQRGEPSPWPAEGTPPTLDDVQFAQERLAAIRVGMEAYFAAVLPCDGVGVVKALAESLIKKLDVMQKNENRMGANLWHPQSPFGENLEALRSALTAVPVAGERKPVGWETAAEWELEKRVFDGVNNKDWPYEASSLIQDLWREYCFAANPYKDSPVPAAVERGTSAATIYETLKAYCERYPTEFAEHLGHLSRQLAALSIDGETEAIIRRVAAITLWRDVYPDGPDVINPSDIHGRGQLPLKPDEVRAARSWLSSHSPNPTEAKER